MLLIAQPSSLQLISLPARSGQHRSWPAFGATLALWGTCRRTRRHLSTLDDRELADVGLTRAQQRAECAKPFWQL